MILLTGATGYIGSRLLKELETRSERVHCLARQPEFLRPKIAPGTEVSSPVTCPTGRASLS